MKSYLADLVQAARFRSIDNSQLNIGYLLNNPWKVNANAILAFV